MITKPDPCRSGKAKSRWRLTDNFNICMELRGVFLPLHVQFIFCPCATLMPDWAGSFSSSSGAGTNGCLDLGCRSCPPSGDRSLSYRSVLAPERDELETVWLFGGEAQLVECLLR